MGVRKREADQISLFGGGILCDGRVVAILMWTVVGKGLGWAWRLGAELFSSRDFQRDHVVSKGVILSGTSVSVRVISVQMS